jgi:superfamily I DNA/RNA helicase
MNVFGEDRLRTSHPAYRRVDDFRRVREGFGDLLDECRDGAAGWDRVVELFLGEDRLALVTAHEAKGLEFRTMIFYGPDSQEWWSPRRDRPEELRNFHVALSRARQGAIFTRASGPGAAMPRLEETLRKAGARTVRKCPKGGHRTV